MSDKKQKTPTKPKVVKPKTTGSCPKPPTPEPKYFGISYNNSPAAMQFNTGKNFLSIMLEDIHSLETISFPNPEIRNVHIMISDTDGYAFALPVADADKAKADWDDYKLKLTPVQPAPEPETIYADYHGVGVSLESNSVLSSQQSLLFGAFGERESAYLCGHIDCVLDITDPKTRNNSEIVIRFKERYGADGPIDTPPVTISLPTEGTAKRVVADFKAWQERQEAPPAPAEPEQSPDDEPRYEYKGVRGGKLGTNRPYHYFLLKDRQVSHEVGTAMFLEIPMPTIQRVDGVWYEVGCVTVYHYRLGVGIPPRAVEYHMSRADAEVMTNDWKQYAPKVSAFANSMMQAGLGNIPWAALQILKHEPGMVKCYCTKCGGVIMCDKAITTLGQIVHVQHDVCPRHTITPSGFALKGRPITPPEGSYVATPFAVKYHGVKLYQDLEKEARDNA